MIGSLLTGKLVRLVEKEPEVMSKEFTRWARDSEYQRLLHFDPASLWSERKWKEAIETELGKENPVEYFFSIETLPEGRFIGIIGLMGIEWNHGNAWVAVGLGERDDWGKGYGTDAMRLILQYAFLELNLNRVTLGFFEYNARAQRSYEKVGFRMEGRQRQMLQRAGKYWDVLIMGITQPEWQQAQVEAGQDKRGQE